MSRNRAVLNYFKTGTMTGKKTGKKRARPKNTQGKKVAAPGRARKNSHHKINSPDELSQSLFAKKGKQSTETFFDSVFQVARMIPRGRVSTYGAIAEYLGSKLSARMVGWAMNAAGSANPPVPAHRVVNRNGMLSGKHHFATPILMEELLRKEKIKVKDDRIEDFKTLYWEPAKELM
jgi:methylated-DNA-protein-cysteine methyltransferase related protein